MAKVISPTWLPGLTLTRELKGLGLVAQFWKNVLLVLLNVIYEAIFFLHTLKR